MSAFFGFGGRGGSNYKAPFNAELDEALKESERKQALHLQASLETLAYATAYEVLLHDDNLVMPALDLHKVWQLLVEIHENSRLPTLTQEDRDALSKRLMVTQNVVGLPMPLSANLEAFVELVASNSATAFSQLKPYNTAEENAEPEIKSIDISGSEYLLVPARTFWLVKLVALTQPMGIAAIREQSNEPFISRIVGKLWSNNSQTELSNQILEAFLNDHRFKELIYDESKRGAYAGMKQAMAEKINR